jgi:hydrogenase maturation protein HypF
MEMESLAAQEPGAPPYSLTEILTEMGLVPHFLPSVIDPAPLIRAVVSDLMAGATFGLIAARFHASMAALISAVCGIIAQQEHLFDVCLSGGVFQNMLLLEQTVDLLAKSGLTVHTHHQVPANDGGLALGQAVVAATMLQRSNNNS